MATVTHSTMTSAEVHEPKHITNGSTGDSGKVITNSSSSNSISEYRRLKGSDVTEKDWVVTVNMEDTQTPGTSVYVVSPVAGTVSKIYSVIDGNFTGSDEVITSKIGGTPITNGAITIATSGSAAGDVDSATPTGANTVAVGDAIELESAGNAAAALKAFFTIVIRES